MTNPDVTEYKLYEIDRAIDDLASLVHCSGCAERIARHDWKATLSRLSDLKADAESIAQSHLIAAE